MKALFSKDVLFSIWHKIDLGEQTERSKTAIKSLPTLGQHVLTVLATAPYLIFAYVLIAGIDIQYRVFEPQSADMVIYASLISLGLLTAANALCYVEANNQFTTRERIAKTGWYVTRRAFRLMGVILLSTMITILGLMMFILPGLYFALRLALASPACLIDDAGIRESMFKSLEATSGQLTLVYTAFSFFGLLFIPTFLALVFTTGWLEIGIVFILFGVYPPIIHTTLGVLYLNGTEENSVNIIETSEEN